MLSYAASVALAAVFSIIVVVDIVGNSLVCYIVFKHRSMHTPMNYLLANLAVADMLVAIFLTPQYIFRLLFSHPGGIAGDFVCKFFTGGFLTWVGGAASAFTLVAIAFERFFCVVYATQPAKHITMKKLKWIVLGCWVYAISVELPPVVVYRYNEPHDYCYEAWPNDIYPKVYTVVTFLLDFAIPTIIMAYLHTQTIRTLGKKGKNPSFAHAQNIAATKAKKRATIMVVIVTVIYSACWLPDVTSYLLAYWHKNFKYGSVLYHTAVVFVGINSCTNPFIYSIQISRFRKHLMKIFRCSDGNRVVTVSWRQSSDSIVNTGQTFHRVTFG